MCWKNNANKASLSPVAARLTKFTILLAFLCFTECAAGGNFRGQPTINKKKISSCLSYGHSCWGAHGKRDGSDIPKNDGKEEMPIGDVPIDTRWFLSRLYQGPQNYRMLNPREGVAPEQRYPDRQLLRDNSDLAEVLRSISDDDVLSQDVVFQDESNYLKNWKENQLIRFLKSQRFGQLNRN